MNFLVVVDRRPGAALESALITVEGILLGMMGNGVVSQAFPGTISFPALLASVACLAIVESLDMLLDTLGLQEKKGQDCINQVMMASYFQLPAVSHSFPCGNPSDGW